MARIWVLVMVILCGVALRESYSLPTDISGSLAAVPGPDPVAHAVSELETNLDGSVARDARSPGYGFSGSYDYDSGAYGGRHFKPHKHKPHIALIPVAIHGGGHGCRKHHGCGGQGYGHGGYGSGSFASASAGSYGGGGPHGGSGSQAQAQSASFSVGPFTFSAAQAQAQAQGTRGGGYGGYGGHGGYGGYGDYGFDDY